MKGKEEGWGPEGEACLEYLVWAGVVTLSGGPLRGGSPVSGWMQLPRSVTSTVHRPLASPVSVFSVFLSDFSLLMCLPFFLCNLCHPVSVLAPTPILGGLPRQVKNLSVIQETQVQSLGWEDPLEKGMATHYSILAWSIPWTEEPGGLQSIGSQRLGHN